MTFDIKPYPEYKDSGLQWLGDIPSHWRLLKTKYLFSERVEKGYPNEPLLAATQTKGVIPKDQYENRTVIAQKDLHLLKLVREGDYVISLRSFQGGIEYAHYQGIISPAYTILKPSSLVKRDFFEYLFKSAQFVDSLTLYITGIREGQNIDYERLSRSLIPVPPVEEQIQIGQFLRDFVSKTNRYIRAKRRQIELLNEQKQAVIQQTVTRGLDPNVRLKPSGVDWIGLIPEHWEVNRIKNIFREVDNRLGNGNKPLLSLSRRRGLVPQEEISKRPPSASDFSKYKVCIPGQLVMNRMQAWSGMFAVCHKEGIVSPDYSIFDIKTEDEVIFFEYLFKLPLYINQFRKKSKGIGEGFNRLYTPDFGSIYVIAPPVSEQSEILNSLVSKCSGINLLISSIDKEITLILEYLTRVIADVVTGKLDVNGVAIDELENAEWQKQPDWVEAIDDKYEENIDMAEEADDGDNGYQ
jgi:type I restriction enzyme S subunit